jgi:lauroyl/myristoyl acyltransferase
MASFKQNLQFKAVKAICNWVEKKVEGKSPEEVRAFGHKLGRLVLRLPFSGKSSVLPALKKVLPEGEDHHKIYRSIFEEQTGRLLPEALLAYQKGGAEDFPFKIIYENFDRIEECVSQGQGVVFVSAHFGSWEALLQAMAWRGLPITGVQRQHNNPLIHEMITNYRQTHGIEIIDFHRRRPESFRECLGALKKGRVLAVLADVVPKTRFVELDFLGKKFGAPMGPALMAQMTGAALIPGYNIREGDSYRFVMCDELTWPNGKAQRDDVPEMTALLMGSLQKFILEHPDHWIWYLRRWRELPFQ